uniref:Uncharacterized protein n=1 Tax=Parascaris equorum TaxID=6256 RepID=A0A914RHQ5_PAREQ
MYSRGMQQDWAKAHISAHSVQSSGRSQMATGMRERLF